MTRAKFSAFSAVVLVSALPGCGGQPSESEEQISRATTDGLTSNSTVYDDQAENGWSYGYWAPTDFNNASPVFAGTKSIAVTFQPSTAMYFTHSGFATQGYSALEFYVNGGKSSGQPVSVVVVTSGNQAQPAVRLSDYCQIRSNTWTKCTVPLAALKATSTTVTALGLMESGGHVEPTLYVDQIRLMVGQTSPPPTSPPPTSPPPTSPPPTSPPPTSPPPTSPPPSGSPVARQWITFSMPMDNAHVHDRTVTFQQSVLAGSTILVFQQEAMLAPADGMRVDDSANVTYSLQDTFSDPESVTKTFIRSNVGAGALSVHGYFPEDQWQTLLAIEIANVSASPVVGHGCAKTDIPGGSSPVTGGIRSPAISVTAATSGSPALLVAFGVNLADYVGGRGAPAAGTGFTTVGTMFNWQGVEVTTNVDSSILESLLVTQPGQVSGTFTTKGSGYDEGFLSCATVLR